MMVDFAKLKDIQKSIAGQVEIKDILEINDVKKIAGFDVAYANEQAYCAGIVWDIKTGTIIEKKCITNKTPMQYVPNFLAFREGPLILQMYYDLETDPDVLMIEGHGIAHPLKCGLATYVGVELGKPTIGIAKNYLAGEVKENDIFLEDEKVGEIVMTKEHANPIYVSPGNFITIPSAVQLVRKTVILPHKLPEPIHQAHLLAKRNLKAQIQKPVLNNSKTEIEVLHS